MVKTKKKLKLIFKSDEKLAHWIIDHFPENYQEFQYLEPYAGSASVFFVKEPSKLEVLNDLNLGLMQIYRALRDEPKEFISRVRRAKATEESIKRAKKKSQADDYLEQAVAEWKTKKIDKEKISHLLGHSKRLSQTHILHKPAIEVIKLFNTEDALLYINPPPLYDAKVRKSSNSLSMTNEEHIALFQAIKTSTAKILVSGFSSPLYNRLYENWKCSKKKMGTKTHILWRNF